jgi:hypothetical protein
MAKSTIDTVLELSATYESPNPIAVLIRGNGPETQFTSQENKKTTAVINRNPHTIDVPLFIPKTVTSSGWPVDVP